MLASEATKISETFDNSLQTILRHIKIMAEGGIKYNLVGKGQYFSDKEESELIRLGYKVEKNWDKDGGIRITWD